MHHILCTVFYSLYSMHHNLCILFNIEAIHFLLGELPMEAKIHRDVFSLFFGVWSKIFQIVKYLLETSSENSRTWAVHIRHLSQKYGLPDPLEYLRADPLVKSQYKENILTKISAYYEKSLRDNASNNSKMLYLNVSLSGLRGRHHPALAGIITTQEVQKSRIHLKMLAGDYLTYEIKSDQSGGSSHCRCCPTPSPVESLEHILTVCSSYADIRSRIIKEYEELCSSTKTNLSFEEIYKCNATFCQFVLDPSSFNLIERVHLNDPILGSLVKLSRDYCHAVNATRMKILKTRASMET